jgi:hypothetical protein
MGGSFENPAGVYAAGAFPNVEAHVGRDGVDLQVD